MSNGALASAITGLRVRCGLLRGLPIRRGRSVQDLPEASIAGYGPLHMMMTPIENIQALMVAAKLIRPRQRSGSSALRL
jgi:hypothetical protein